MVLASPSSRRCLAGGEAPSRSLTALLTAAGLDKTTLSSFYNFEQGLSVPIRFMWQYYVPNSSSQGTCWYKALVPWVQLCKTKVSNFWDKIDIEKDVVWLDVKVSICISQP
jgi:hypothetical protein